MTAQTLTSPERTGFVKRYPRAVVRIARPIAGRPAWGPMWKIWFIGSDGKAIQPLDGGPAGRTASVRTTALNDAALAVGIARHLRDRTMARAGGLS